MKRLYLFFSLMLFASIAYAQEAKTLTHMPAWELKKQDGTVVKSSDFDGKPLILHFWATWCPYCKVLQPGLERLSKTYKAQGLEVLAVSLQEEDGAKPQTALIERGLTLQTVVKGEKLGLETFAIRGTPTTVFIGPDGAILGSTTESNPDDPQWDSVAQHLIQLPRNTDNTSKTGEVPKADKKADKPS